MHGIDRVRYYRQEPDWCFPSAFVTTHINSTWRHCKVRPRVSVPEKVTSDIGYEKYSVSVSEKSHESNSNGDSQKPCSAHPRSFSRPDHDDQQFANCWFRVHRPEGAGLVASWVWSPRPFGVGVPPGKRPVASSPSPAGRFRVTAALSADLTHPGRSFAHSSSRRHACVTRRPSGSYLASSPTWCRHARVAARSSLVPLAPPWWGSPPVA